MNRLRALPTIKLMPAASSRQAPVATPAWCGVWTSRKERAAANTRGKHPICHHVAEPNQTGFEVPDKAGRRRAPLHRPPSPQSSGEDAMT